MVARTLRTLTAVALAAGLATGAAMAAEAPRVVGTPRTELVAHEELFRHDVEGYVRELGRQMRATLNEELRRELKRTVVSAPSERRTTT